MLVLQCAERNFLIKKKNNKWVVKKVSYLHGSHTPIVDKNVIN